MRKIFLPILLFVLPSVVFAQGAWVNYTSNEGHYSVSFPGTPTESTQNSGSDSLSAKLYVAMYIMDKDVFASEWMDLNGIFAGPVKEFLEGTKDGVVQSLSGTNAKVTASDFTGNAPYIEFTFKVEERIGKARIYIIDNKAYSLIALIVPGSDTFANADKYIQSFKHLH